MMAEPLYSRCGMRCDQCHLYRPNVEQNDQRPAVCAAYRKHMDAYRKEKQT